VHIRTQRESLQSFAKRRPCRGESHERRADLDQPPLGFSPNGNAFATVHLQCLAIFFSNSCFGRSEKEERQKRSLRPLREGRRLSWNGSPFSAHHHPHLPSPFPFPFLISHQSYIHSILINPTMAPTLRLGSLAPDFDAET